MIFRRRIGLSLGTVSYMWLELFKQGLGSCKKRKKNQTVKTFRRPKWLSRAGSLYFRKFIWGLRVVSALVMCVSFSGLKGQWVGLEAAKSVRTSGGSHIFLDSVAHCQEVRVKTRKDKRRHERQKCFNGHRRRRKLLQPSLHEKHTYKPTIIPVRSSSATVCPRVLFEFCSPTLALPMEIHDFLSQIKWNVPHKTISWFIKYSKHDSLIHASRTSFHLSF